MLNNRRRRRATYIQTILLQNVRWIPMKLLKTIPAIPIRRKFGCSKYWSNNNWNNSIDCDNCSHNFSYWNISTNFYRPNYHSNYHWSRIVDIWKDEVFLIWSIKIIIYYNIIWKIIFLIPEEDFSDTMMIKDEEQFGMQ